MGKFEDDIRERFHAAEQSFSADNWNELEHKLDGAQMSDLLFTQKIVNAFEFSLMPYAASHWQEMRQNLDLELSDNFESKVRSRLSELSHLGPVMGWEKVSAGINSGSGDDFESRVKEKFDQSSEDQGVAYQDDHWVRFEKIFFQESSSIGQTLHAVALFAMGAMVVAFLISESPAVGGRGDFIHDFLTLDDNFYQGRDRDEKLNRVGGFEQDPLGNHPAYAKINELKNKRPEEHINEKNKNIRSVSSNDRNELNNKLNNKFNNKFNNKLNNELDSKWSKPPSTIYFTQLDNNTNNSHNSEGKGVFFTEFNHSKNTEFSDTDAANSSKGNQSSNENRRALEEDQISSSELNPLSGASEDRSSEQMERDYLTGQVEDVSGQIIDKEKDRLESSQDLIALQKELLVIASMAKQQVQMSVPELVKQTEKLSTSITERSKPLMHAGLLPWLNFWENAAFTGMNGKHQASLYASQNWKRYRRDGKEVQFEWNQPLMMLGGYEHAFQKSGFAVGSYFSNQWQNNWVRSELNLSGAYEKIIGGTTMRLGAGISFQRNKLLPDGLTLREQVSDSPQLIRERRLKDEKVSSETFLSGKTGLMITNKYLIFSYNLINPAIIRFNYKNLTDILHEGMLVGTGSLGNGIRMSGMLKAHNHEELDFTPGISISKDQSWFALTEYEDLYRFVFTLGYEFSHFRAYASYGHVTDRELESSISDLFSQTGHVAAGITYTR